jgi:RNA polymerase sigma factor (sigma-70 family)
MPANQEELIQHLFRTEYSKICSVLCRSFGIEHVEVAEDIASETFLLALETWTFKGIPENPAAWLYFVAKNKTKNYLKRNCHLIDIRHDAAQINRSHDPMIEIDLSPKNITDSQLQMLFTICQPSLSEDSQICLALRLLCGFGIDEIATAFLTSKDVINKRLYRAKEKLKFEKIKIEFPSGNQISTRLETVLTTLYLLYNEGYYSESNDTLVREELCLEAMRLASLLLENELTNLPQVNALLALMCFQSSRLAARTNKNGNAVLYQDQDETLWDKELISQGAYYLKRASHGNSLSTYHLEASIAYQHTFKTDTGDKWEKILQLYNLLLQTAYSPIAALNRTFALSKVHGKHVAIIEAEKLELTDNHFYFTLLGELYTGIDNQKAKSHLRTARSLAKTTTDKKTIQGMIDNLG